MRSIFTCLMMMATLYVSAQKNTLVIRNVNVISMASAEQKVDNAMDVYIKNGVISKITITNSSTPKNAIVIDGTGKYLMPGMADMHVHLPRAKSIFNTKQFLLMTLGHGVTAMRQMRGLPQDLLLRDSIKKGLVLGSDLYVSTPFFKRTDTFDAKSCYDSLALYKKQGYDLVKYLYGMNESQYDSFQTMANKLGFIVAGHAAAGKLDFAVTEGEHVEHIDPFVKLYKKDSVLFWQTIDAMAAKHLFNCPDVFWYNTVGYHVTTKERMKYPGMEYVPDSTKQQWEKEERDQALRFFVSTPVNFAKYIINDSTNVALYKYLLPRMYNKGVPLLISPGDGDYVNPGFSYVEELKIFVASGLTPYQTLRCATYNAADFFKQTDKWGTVTENKAANLLLLNANPLEDINNVNKTDAIILHGKVLKKDELMKMAMN
ncbi:MAG: amidohydrolase family protein [Bacteroidetes bacterium]|nr:amidohydrolase family protein [Bacteroidota bacterium]